MPGCSKCDELAKRVEELERRLAASEKERADLQQKGAYLQAILDTARLPIYVKTSDYKYLLVNRQYEKLARVKNEEIKGKTDFDIFPEPVATLFRAQDEEAKRENRQVDFEETIPLPDGEFTFVTSKFPLHDEHGNTYAVAGVCTDVTNLKRAQWAQKVSEERFKAIIENSPMGVHMIEINGDGELIFAGANPASSKILNIDCNQFNNKPVRKVFPALEGTGLLEKLRAICEEGTSWSKEQVRYSDGRVDGIFELFGFQASKNMAAVFFSEVSQRVRMEREIRKNQKMESIGLLAGGIAHDFNNTLTAILGGISLAKHYIGPENPKAVSLLEEAEKASFVARNLTHQLLTFSKGGEPVKKIASILEVIRDSAEFVLRGSNTRCEYRTVGDIWPVEVDTDQMSQVIQNLIINASQAMPTGGVVRVDCESCRNDGALSPLLPRGDFVRISIADTGVGIPKEMLGRIFEPYFTTKQKGSGLGLAITHSIISRHGGHIEVESKLGAGTTFTLFLPATRSEQISKIDEDCVERNGMSGRILVMDDADMVSKIAEHMLAYLGFRVVSVRDGDEAIAAYKAGLESDNPFELVILDLTVPGALGGEQAAKEILCVDSEARMIVSTGYSTAPIMAKYRDYGFKAALAKPYRMSDLVKVVQRVWAEGRVQNLNQSSRN